MASYLTDQKGWTVVMTTQQLQDMFVVLAKEMMTHTDELCKLDSYIGDGDHGTTIERGFKATLEAIEGKTFEKPAEVLKATGDAIMNTTGGAIGPILGSFFRGGCKKLANAEAMDTAEFEIMFASGLRQVKMIGEANEGDRTLVDALSPAAAAFSAAKEAGLSLGECLAKAADAAEAGAQETKNMIAKKGRAKFLGEKSLGYVDAGATSMSIIIRTLSNYVNK